MSALTVDPDKKHELDPSMLLKSDWGFLESHCFLCGVHNNDIGGYVGLNRSRRFLSTWSSHKMFLVALLRRLLMKCSKCKKVSADFDVRLAVLRRLL